MKFIRNGRLFLPLRQRLFYSGGVSSGGVGGGGGSGGGGGWPNNEPPGMTPLLTFNGSDKWFGVEGSLSGVPNDGNSRSGAGWFFGGRWNNNTYIEQNIADAASRYGTVMQKRQFIGDPSDWNGLAALNAFAGGASYNEVYYRWIVKYSANYEIHPLASDKFFYWGESNGNAARPGGGTSPTSFFIHVKPSLGVYIQNQSNNAGDTPWPLGEVDLGFSMTLGDFNTFEMHCVAESALGTANGQLHIRRNGTLVYTNSAVSWLGSNPTYSADSPGFSGVELYNFFGGSGANKTVNDVISLSEFYVSGK